MHKIQIRNNRPLSYKGYVSRPIVDVKTRVSRQRPVVKTISDVKPVLRNSTTSKNINSKSDTIAKTSSMIHQKNTFVKTNNHTPLLMRPRNHISGVPMLPEPSKFKFFRKRKPITILRKNKKS